MHDGRSGDLLASQHPGNLRHPLLGIIQAADTRERMAAGIFFPHKKMRRGEAGDLRKMRDADDLIARGELLQLSTDDLRHPPTDACVDLVKHERRAGRTGRGFEERGGDG